MTAAPFEMVGRKVFKSLIGQAVGVKGGERMSEVNLTPKGLIQASANTPVKKKKRVN